MGCVYLATNCKNGKQYVGKTIHSLCNRKHAHEKCAIKGSKTAFHNAIRKYGFAEFTWEILVEENDTALLNNLEQAYIKKLNTKSPNGYNLTDGGDGLNNPSDVVRRKIGVAFRGKKLTPEHIEKCTKAFHSPEARAKHLVTVNSIEYRTRASLAQRGKKQSAESKDKKSKKLMWHIVTKETRNKISLSKKGQTHTAESKAKMSKSQKGKTRSEAFKIAVGNYWRGRKRSEKNCIALRKANIGKKLSVETRTKISLAGKGRKASSATKAKLSAIHKGHQTSSSTREKISAALKSTEGQLKLKAASVRNRNKRIESLRRWNRYRDWESCSL